MSDPKNFDLLVSQAQGSGGLITMSDPKALGLDS